MKQYFKYFSVLYIIFGILLAITAVVFIGQLLMKEDVKTRANHECPTERVYDYADVLTDEEEDKLRERIALAEARTQCDLVIVTINESIIDYCGYEYNTDANWEDSMMNYADDFYDQNCYGYDKVHGDGALLLDNWYLEGTSESQAGSWLSTCGAVYDRYSTYMIDDLLDEVYYGLDYGTYRAYLEYIDHIERYMSSDSEKVPLIPFGACFVVALIPAIIFVAIHLKSKEGNKTTNQSTYVDVQKSGNTVFKERRDELIDKRVTSVRIQTSSGGSGGGSRSSGRGGSHRSSSGVRHGGGGRRR